VLNLADLEGSDLDNLLGDLSVPQIAAALSPSKSHSKSSSVGFMDDESLLRQIIMEEEKEERPCLKEAFLRQKAEPPKS
jgi:ribosomal protein L12E/L44/L45/RPP1/RPP2